MCDMKGLLTIMALLGVQLNFSTVKEEKKKKASVFQYNLKLNYKENYKLESNLTPLGIEQ